MNPHLAGLIGLCAGILFALLLVYLAGHFDRRRHPHSHDDNAIAAWGDVVGLGEAPRERA